MAALQGAVLSQSSAQMAGNYYYNPSSTIGSKEPGKESSEQIPFPVLSPLVFSARGCQGENV